MDPVNRHPSKPTLRSPRAGPFWPAWLLVAVFLLLLLPGTAQADALDDETRRIAKGLQCPVCQSVSVADSPSELAGQMRAVIRRKLEQGETEPEILAYFVERYGDGVLLEPPRRGFSLAAWAMPVLVLGGGAVVLMLALHAWLRPRAPAGARAPGAEARLRADSDVPSLGGTDSHAARVRAELEGFRGNR